MALDRHFKPIIKPLQQIVDSPVRVTITHLPPSVREKRRRRRRRKRKKRRSRRRRRRRRERKRARRSSVPQPRKSDDRLHDRVELITSTPRSKIVPTIESLDNVFETTEDC